MGCSVYASMFVGFKFDEVVKIVEKMNEKYITKFDEDTGSPYQKDVSEFTYSLEIFGEEIEFDDDHEDFHSVQYFIQTYFKDSDITTTYGDEVNLSTMLIGIRLAKTDDLMYGGGDEEVSLEKVTKAIDTLKKYGKEPKLYLTTNVSC